MRGYDPEALTAERNYRILTTATAPRPIGWVSTTSESGVDNLAPFSHYNNVCTTRPMVIFSVDPRDDGDEKHTLTNVKRTGAFVVNVVTESQVEPMERTADEIDEDRDEFQYAGVERQESEEVRPPRVAGAPVQFECTLYDLLDIYDREVVLGEVEYIHVDASVQTDGKIDVAKLDTVGRLGGRRYSIPTPTDYDVS
jgi:flavin reductase (DIM6/NTAB) family NADH-FMN oxidoreductase RutF